MIYAEVIGDPVAHSKSPLIHKFWLDALGIAADYRATRVEAAGLAAYFTERARDPDWRTIGISPVSSATEMPPATPRRRRPPRDSTL